MVIRKDTFLAALSAFALVLGPVVAADAASKRTNAVYVAQNQTGANSVAAFIQDAKNGRLTLVDTYLTGGTGDGAVDGNQSHALASNGSFLFVTNSGDHTVTSFRVRDGGVLRRVGSYSSQGYVPVSLAVRGDRLIVANQGSVTSNLPGGIRVFRIAKSGALTRIRKSHFDFPPTDTPAEVLASQSSSVFSVGLSGSNRIDNFILTSSGTIVRTDSVPGVLSPLGGAVKSASRTTFIYTLPSTVLPGVVALRVNSRGKTEQMYQETREDLEDPCWAAIHPDGTRVWLSSFETRALSLYSINRDGVMSAVSDYTPVTTGPGATDVAVDARGRYLFRLRGFDVTAPSTPLNPVVDTLRIGSSTKDAGLSLVQTVPLPSSWATTQTTGVEVVAVARSE